MLKREITYKNLDGETVTNEFYFNLTKAEIAELELSHFGGLGEFIKRVSATQDQKVLVEEFKRIILLCYGIRDGDSFIKTDQLRQRFEGTNAYSELFIEFLTVPGSLETFIRGVVPQEWEEERKAAEKKAVMPPPPLPDATVEAGRQIVQDANL